MELTLGFSTCPNDTFIFDAMVNGKVDTYGIRFKYHLTDVEELNRKAFNAEYDITKISYHAYSYIAENYLLLNSGSALGHNNGPLLISNRRVETSSVKNLRIGIPGKYTTANLLFMLAWPEADNISEYLFSDIEDALINGKIDAGLIIHENRFTYENRGLQKICDLGEYWDDLTSLPIPLGGIAIRRDVPEEIALTVDTIIRKSIEHSLRNPESPFDFIRRYAVTMEREVMNRHIQLYVNDYTLNLGEEGRGAVRKLYQEASERGVIPAIPLQIFAGDHI